MTTRPVNLHRQRGAATLIAAIFLVVSLSLMVTGVLYMAGSDSNDISMQDDAAQALFIAETGLEHAGYWFDAGTACANLVLAPNNSATVGRGSFTITAATLIGSRCRVRVVATVNQTYAVKRTIEGDIEPGAESEGVWAVGNNGVILYWDGASWSTSTTVGTRLNSVYCISSTDCWAVGNSQGGHGTIRHWNGSSWSGTGFTNSTPNEHLYSVTCISANDCWAVGDQYSNDGVIVHWNGTSWSESGFTVATHNAPLNSVNCVSSTDCWAVGDENGSPANIADWNGSTSWSNSGFTNSTAQINLNGVSCIATNNCWAVGDRRFSRGYLARWNGSSWSGSGFTNSTPNQNLNAVSCISSTDCWAVGNRASSHGTIVHWNGSSWSTAGFTNNSPNQHLLSVHCTTTGNCWAAGANGTTVHLDTGNTWTHHHFGSNTLYGIFALGSGAGGSTRLIRWQEIAL